MGFLKRLFNTDNLEQSQGGFQWKELNKLHQIDQILKDSNSRAQLIFKHSTRCGISRAVLNQFEAKTKKENIDYYFLDLLRYRDISNAIASKLKIEHQSPQVVLIKDKKVKAHDSHYAIMSLDILIDHHL